MNQITYLIPFNINDECFDYGNRIRSLIIFNRIAKRVACKGVWEFKTEHADCL